MTIRKIAKMSREYALSALISEQLSRDFLGGSHLSKQSWVKERRDNSVAVLLV